MSSLLLRENTYQFVPEFKPEWTRKQRIKGVVSGDSYSFIALRPIPRSLLSARAYIKWSFQVQRKEAGAPVNYRTFNQEVIQMKEFMLMANSTKNISININGYGMVYQEPRYWSKMIGRMFANNRDRQTYFTTSGAPPISGEGAYSNQGLNVDDAGAPLPGVHRNDDNLETAMDLAWVQYQIATSGAPSNTATFTVVEPLYAGPFNPFFDTKSEGWYKRLSNTIPYVHQLEVHILTSNHITNCLQIPYSLSTATFDEPITYEPIGTPTAELVLEWIVPPVDIKLPFRIDIPSWEIDHRIFSVNGGNFIADSIFTPPITPIDTLELHLNQVPTWIILFASRNKDDGAYSARALFTDTDGAGTNGTDNPEVNSYEPAMVISDLQITTDINNRYVTTEYNTRELYNITAKNSCSIPGDYASFLGGNSKYGSSPSMCYVALTSDDLSIKYSTGTKRNQFTLQIEANLTTATGFNRQRSNDGALGNYPYLFHVALVYAEDFITLSKDRKVEKRLHTQFV